MATLPEEHGARDPFLRMHAVNVYVRNQERSLRFYLDINRREMQVARDRMRVDPRGLARPKTIGDHTRTFAQGGLTP